MKKLLATANESHYYTYMIVCLCNALRENQLETAISQGAATAGDVFNKIGCQPMCGKCLPEVQDVIESRSSISVSS